ncbi:MAG: AmmeMemoRadiSam system protein B [Armatimonadota bacterium]|nr:AmmeMemoRadiSam system protein B [Armatimonadota bacterium]
MPEEVRRPVVAGQFYAGTSTELMRQIEECFTHRLGPGALPEVRDEGPRRILGVISPHAGYVFSGATAAHGYDALAADGMPDVFVVVGLNHGRGGLSSAVQTSGAWETPLGTVPIAEEVAGEIAGRLPDFSFDPQDMAMEHSLEVQLPFLQYLYEEHLMFVPVMMSDQDLDSARAVGRALANALADLDAVIIASTDMTHYEQASSAKRKDNLLIQRIEALDAEGLVRERQSRGISMCGVGPVAATIIAATALGATEVESLAYSTSGDVMPAEQVVGYYSAVIRR